MANRNFFTDLACNIPGLVLVHFRFVFDADVGVSAGVDATEVGDAYNGFDYLSSHIRTAEGTFKFYLTDKWTGLAGWLINRVKDADVDVVVLSEDVDNSTPGSGYIEVAFQTAGTDADPDGETVEFNLLLHNSTEGYNAS